MSLRHLDRKQFANKLNSLRKHASELKLFPSNLALTQILDAAVGLYMLQRTDMSAVILLLADSRRGVIHRFFGRFFHIKQSLELNEPMDICFSPEIVQLNHLSL